MMAGVEHYVRKEIQRMEACAARALKEAQQQLVTLKLKGTVHKEQGLGDRRLRLEQDRTDPSQSVSEAPLRHTSSRHT